MVLPKGRSFVPMQRSFQMKLNCSLKMSLGSLNRAMGQELMMHLQYVSMVGRILTLTDCVRFGRLFMMTCGLLVMRGGPMRVCYGLPWHQSPAFFPGQSRF